jgi:hypothetical protein
MLGSGFERLIDASTNMAARRPRRAHPAATALVIPSLLWWRWLHK